MAAGALEECALVISADEKEQKFNFVLEKANLFFKTFFFFIGKKKKKKWWKETQANIIVNTK